MKVRSSLLIACLVSLMVLIAGCGGSSSSGGNPNPPAAISVAFSAQPPSGLTAGATANLSATVSNDSANAGVTWTVTCNTSSCGSFNPTSTASGATTTFTAPATAPSNGVVTVVATSVTDKTKSASAQIPITAAPAISVALSPQPPSSLITNATASLTAVVSNDSANAGVTWTVTCSSSPCGSFSPASTASGTATTFTAPATVPASGNVTVVATSVTDKTKSASATIAITASAPVGITVALSPAAPSSLAAGTTASLTAVVSGDSANAGVTWTVTCGGSDCGSFNPASTASGAATTYTTPLASPTGGTVTVVATSVTDKTKNASAVITIGAPAGPLKDGTYVFHAAGEDQFTVSGQVYTSPYFVAGAFTVANGSITGGEQDFMDYGFPGADKISASGSSISVTSDGNIQVVLSTGDPNVGVNGVETFNGTKVSSSRVLLNEYDGSASGAGSIDLQTSVAAPSGGYAFVVNGIDNNPTNQYAIGIGGVLNFNGTSLNTSGSVYDCSDGGSPIVFAQTFTSGSVSAPDSFGRVTIAVTPNSSCAQSQIIFAGYMANGQIQLVETQDAYSGNQTGVLGGVALSQGSNTGQFSASNINGQTYVFSALGADGNGQFTLGGGLIFGASGSLSGQLALNDTVIYGGANFTAANYAVDSTGRVSLTNITTQTGNSTTFTLQLGVYLDGNGNALELGLDSNQVTTGMAYQQTNGTFPSSGNAGLLAQGFVGTTSTVNNFPYWSAVGPLAMSSGSFSGTFDYNQQGGSLYPSQSLSATVNTTTGVISTPDLDFNGYQDGFGYYVIDGSRVLAVEADGNQLGLLQIEAVSPK